MQSRLTISLLSAFAQGLRNEACGTSAAQRDPAPHRPNSFCSRSFLDHTCKVAGDTNRTDLGVGEEVTLKFIPDLITNTYWQNTWSTTAGSVAPAAAISTSFTAPSNASPATVTATVGDEKLDVSFGVSEPSGIDHADIIYRFPYALGFAGAGMHLRPYLSPTNVSFYRLQCMEIGEDASSVTGYFTQFAADFLSHKGHGADQWFGINCDNSWKEPWDDARSAQFSPAWGQGGGFTWIIPAKWKVGDGPEHEIHFSDQEFSMDASGTMQVKKFKRTVTRPTSEYYGTAQ